MKPFGLKQLNERTCHNCIYHQCFEMNSGIANPTHKCKKYDYDLKSNLVYVCSDYIGYKKEDKS